MGYHLREIKKGVYGQVSKVREELEELEEALEQNNRIMALIEASDLIGALEAWAVNNGSSLQELITMKNATNRAFEDGTRKPATEKLDRAKDEGLQHPYDDYVKLIDSTEDFLEPKDEQWEYSRKKYAPVNPRRKIRTRDIVDPEGTSDA